MNIIKIVKQFFDRNIKIRLMEYQRNIIDIIKRLAHDVLSKISVRLGESPNKMAFLKSRFILLNKK